MAMMILVEPWDIVLEVESFLKLSFGFPPAFYKTNVACASSWKLEAGIEFGPADYFSQLMRGEREMEFF